MKRLLPVLVLWILFSTLLAPQPVKAQHGDYPPLPADAWKGQVEGKVINQTTEKTLTEPVEVMLHAWDLDNQERLMMHGNANPDGTFLFEGVDLYQDFTYSVMSTYQGATYYSQPANAKKGETTLKVDALVYNTTSDLTNVKIDRLHTLFYIHEGQLGISQFYALSNTGNLTVKDAINLPRERKGTLKFNLPEEAQNVKFGNDSSGSRFALLSNGFVDTAPITPGEGTGQVVVGYNLPYSGKMDFNYVAPAAIEGVSFLVMEGSGITLEGKGLTPAGERTLDDGSKFSIYTATPMKAGESLQITLKGMAEGSTMSPTMTEPKKSSSAGIGIGAGVLGVALLGVGIWWWRRRDQEEIEAEVEEIGEEEVEKLLAEIHSLDELYGRGEISEEGYQEKRQDLRERLKAAINQPA